MPKAKIYGEESRGFYAIYCPGCETSHAIATIIPFDNGAKWTFNGSLDRPTFSPSLLVRTGKYIPGHEDFDDEGYPLSSICHSFITDGRIQFLSDCTHKLAGQTVDLPEIITE